MCDAAGAQSPPRPWRTLLSQCVTIDYAFRVLWNTRYYCQLRPGSRQSREGGKKGVAAVAEPDHGRARDHGRETDVAVVFRWAGVLRSRLLHAPAGSPQGEGAEVSAQPSAVA